MQQCFLADARIATEAKEEAFDALVAEMKRQLKRSEVDAQDNPTALTSSAGTPKPQSTAVRKPGCPATSKRTNKARHRPPRLESPVPGKGGSVRSTSSSAANSPRGNLF